MIQFVVLLIIAALAYILHKKVYKAFKLQRFYSQQLANKKHRVYFMRFLPFLSEMLLSLISDSKNHRDAYWSEKHYGQRYDLLICNFGSELMLRLINPDLIKELYALDAGKTYKKYQPILENIKRIAGVSITFSEGQRWRIKRKVMTSFLNFSYVNLQFDFISCLVNKKVQEISKGKNQFQVYLLELLEQVTGGTIVELFFGGSRSGIQSYEIDGQKITSFMRELMQMLGIQTLSPLSMIFGPKFPTYNLTAFDRKVSRKVELYKKFIHNFIQDRIYEIKQDSSRKEDYIEKVYRSVPEAERTPEFVQDMVYDFSTLFIAGTDTTSHSAMMLLYLIMMNPQVKSKLEEEITKYFKKEEQTSFDKMKEMKYLDCVVHEAMRYYQPANGVFFREVQEDHYLADIKIKKGTLLLIESMSNHYNPGNFEHPFEFKPERWMKEDGSFQAPKPYTWLTFSAGPRSCIGKQLAFLEMKLITVNILRKYDVSMENTDLTMLLNNLSYQPQKLMTKFKLRSTQ